MTEAGTRGAAVPSWKGPPLGDLVGTLESRGFLRTFLPGGSDPPAAIPIGRVALDSRRVEPGTLFVAVSGQHADGHEYVSEAVSRGAVAVIAERATPRPGVPELLVHASRPALAVAAAWREGFPSRRLGVVGVTGTDGKTTTAYLLHSMFGACGMGAGIVGTIDVVVGGRSLGNPGRSTTPEAPELHAHLAAMVAAGDEWAIVESTSHGLAQDRVAEVAYDVAVLTNVTHEHLEFHRTPEAYRAAKRRLFEWLTVGPANPDKGWPKTAVVNRDDGAADEFLDAARGAGARILTYGAASGADVRATAVRENADGLRFDAITPRGPVEIALRLVGRFNVHNGLAALAVGEALELDQEAIARGLAGLSGVAGRMERIDVGQPFGVIVDYAHTPEALAKVLDNLAPLAAAGGGGLIAVFGSAGERDRLKRPLMGRVAGERCRLVVVTEEDPRGEDPEAVLDEIAAGAEEVGRRRGQDLLVVADRREAIAMALDAARVGDVVVLAGKGHEQTIEGPDGPRPWDEAAATRDALRVIGWESGATHPDPTLRR